MKRHGFSFFGWFLFFITIAVTVTAAVMIYSVIDGMEEWRIAVIMLIVVAGLSLICTAVDLIRRKLIVERVTDEISAATLLMSKGNFDVRLTPRHSYKNYDEYDRVMINLNALAVELSKTEMLRNDFISNVSHEIKTPLSVIANYACALKVGGLDRDTEQKYLDTLVNASKRLSGLVMNILKLNKLENSFRAQSEEFELGEQLRECVLSFEQIIEDKSLELDCDIDDVLIRSDASLLETVWNNLISNAVKFTPDGGKISVSLKNYGDRITVQVADTGCGISAETGEHIFDKFYQGDTSHSAEGNGLGLTMVKRVIDILGGQINVKSQVGQGAVFTVTLRGAEQ